MRASVLPFPSVRGQAEVMAIYDVLMDLAEYSPPLARSHSARLFLKGVLTENQYAVALTRIDGSER